MSKKPFVFVVRCKPAPNNKDYHSIKGAIVHVWVFDDSVEAAKQKAIEYIKSYHWLPIIVERELSMLPEQIPHLDIREQMLYQKALQYGISAEFLASPIRELDPGTQPEHRKV